MTGNKNGTYDGDDDEQEGIRRRRRYMHARKVLIIIMMMDLTIDRMMLGSCLLIG